MRRISAKEAEALVEVATVIEMEARSRLQEMHREEARILSEVDRLSSQNPEVGMDQNLAATGRWLIWTEKRRRALFSEVALLRARRAMLVQDLSIAMGKLEAVEAIRYQAVRSERMKCAEKNNERLLQEDILSSKADSRSV